MCSLDYSEPLIKEFKICVKTEYPSITRQVHPYIQKYIDELIAIAINSSINKMFIFGSSICEWFSINYSDIDIAIDSDEEEFYKVYSEIRKLISIEQELDVINISSFDKDSDMFKNIYEGVLLYDKEDII